MNGLRRNAIWRNSGPRRRRNPTGVVVLADSDLKTPKVDVFFVYPEELRNSKRVAVFRDFLLTKLAQRA